MTESSVQTIFEVTRPEPIDSDAIQDNFVEEIVITKYDYVSTYGVYVLTPNDEMPTSVAEWLYYRTITEPVVAAENDGDYKRFRSVEEIQKKFLQDRGGRTLYFALDEEEGSLMAVAWLHPLHNDQSDRLLVAAGRKGLKDDKVDPSELATIATREYNKAVRTGTTLRLGTLAIDKCFDASDQFRGVIGIFGDGDNMALELVGSGFIPEGTSMRYVDNGPGWVILMAMRNHDDKITYM